jgi:beta-glucosidase
MQNFGDFTFANADDIVNTDSRKYLMYNEGIYVGYRYYETRYEDAVLNRGNASSSAGVFASEDGAWKYGEEVQFSFGYGLSYSDFTQTLDSVSVNWENKTAEIKVTVSNGSDRAGKDVVQVYAQAPYTAGGIEKSAVQLCGFAKTGVINGGKSETVTVNVDLRDIASYDYETYKTYVLEQGDYYFAIGNGAHDALNNILAAKGKTVADGMDYNGNAAKVQKENKAKFNADEYKLSANKKTITNQFESTDINYYLQSNDEIKYLSRENWQETWPENMTGFSATKGMIDEAASYYSAKTDGTTSPTAYEKGSSDTSSVTLGAEQKYTLAMMIGADYDDAAWDLLLDQLTVQDYLDSTSQGRKPLKSVGLNATTAVDGPSAWTKSYYIEDYKNQYDAEKVVKTDELMVAYPTETIIASTWNVELTYELGKSFGEEGLWGGGVGWYGPGANTHRTPYGGRNFEYYSEDGFISGKLGEAECKGAMEKGTIPYFKHFFLNDQETNRIGVCTFSNEQAIREVYLRAFQYAFETTGENDKACTGVMGAFNRLGMTWTGHHKNLWKNVMEGEWGFTGNVTTDFGQKQGSLMEPQLAYEAGTHMFCTSGSGFANYLDGLDITKDLKLLTNMRESLHRQLYNFANSAAMNGLTSNSKIVTVRTWYENALLATTVISAVLLAGSGAMAVIQSFFNKKEEE